MGHQKHCSQIRSRKLDHKIDHMTSCHIIFHFLEADGRRHTLFTQSGTQSVDTTAFL